MHDKEICRQCKGKYCTKKISIFGIFDETQQQEINRFIIHRKYKKGQTIFSEGDISDKFFLITKGQIKLSKYSKEGNEQLLYIVAEGDYLGDLSLLKKSICTHNAEALDDTTVCILTKDDFDNILRKNTELALKILEVFHDRIIHLESLLQTLGLKDIESRLAGLLLSFIKDFGTPTSKGVILNVPLSREDIANHLGTSRETISRKLSMLQDQSIIDLVGYKKILIKNLALLEQLSS